MPCHVLICEGPNDNAESAQIPFVTTRTRDYSRAKKKAEADKTDEDNVRVRRRSVGLLEGSLFKQQACGDKTSPRHWRLTLGKNDSNSSAVTGKYPGARNSSFPIVIALSTKLRILATWLLVKAR